MSQALGISQLLLFFKKNKKTCLYVVTQPNTCTNRTLCLRLMRVVLTLLSTGDESCATQYVLESNSISITARLEGDASRLKIDSVAIIARCKLF